MRGPSLPRWGSFSSRFLVVVLAFAIAACATPAFADDADSKNKPVGDAVEAVPRPKLNPVAPYKEDWSSFADGPIAPDDLFDPIKYVPLAGGEEGGEIWASFGGQARVRYEMFENFAFGPANDDDYLLTRFRLHSDVHVGKNVRVFAEVKSAYSTTRALPGGQRTLDVDELAVQNLFAEVLLPIEGASVIVKAGRQELLFGKQRLVSPLDWSNSRRAWDGVSVIVKTGDWTITPFWTQFAPVQKYKFNQADAQTQFFGIYATGKAPNSDVGLDLYFLGLDVDGPVTFNGTTGREDRYTIGGRVFGKVGETGIDYDAEAAYQFGGVGGGDINAFMLGGQVGMKVPDCAYQSRVFIGLDYASGDDGAGGDVETFNQLFPLGHAYLGYVDAIGRQNVIDLSPGISLKPIDKVTVVLQGHMFWRADTSDAVYHAGGGVLRAGGLSSEREIGSEIDLLVKYQHDAHSTIVVGYSHFFAGDFIETATPAADDDIDFLYVIYQFTF